jgi:hypothetical protein
LAHAIIDASSPGSNIGQERNAVDEGIGDYFAGFYTRSIFPDSQWEKVPSWDGHNEFWSGRKVDANKTYPESLEGDKYQDGEIWSSVLTLIEGKLGRDLTHKLLVESSFLYHEGMSMREAASYFLKADTLLNNGVNSGVMR